MINVCRHRGAELLGDGHRQGEPDHLPVPRLELRPEGLPARGLRRGDVRRRRQGRDGPAHAARGRAGRHRVRLARPRRDHRPRRVARGRPDHPARGHGARLAPTTTRRARLDGPNWKVVIDGYLEGYHFASLHRTTVFRTNFSNMAAFDKLGPAPAQLVRAAPDRDRGRAARRQQLGPGAVRRRDLLAVPRPGHRRRLALAGRRVAGAARHAPGTPRTPSRSSRCGTSRRRRRAQGRRAHPRLVPRRRHGRGLRDRLRRPARPGRVRGRGVRLRPQRARRPALPPGPEGDGAE